MTDESEIQKDIKGRWNKWEHITGKCSPQSENKFLPNYIEKEKPMIPTAFAKGVKSK